MRKRAAYEIDVSGQVVVLAELLPSELLAVIKSVQGEKSPTAADIEISQEGLRRSIREIGGAKVNYTDLVGGMLGERFKRYRHINQLSAAWGRIHNPAEGDAEAMSQSMVVTEDAAGELYTLDLPGFRLTEAAPPSPARVVVFREQDTESVKSAARAADAYKSPLGRALAVMMSAMRRSLVAVDGRAVKDIDVAGWDELFTVRETMLLSVAWESVHGGLAGDGAGGLRPVSGT